MKKHLITTLLLVVASFPPLFSQNDSLPQLGGLILNDSVFATAGEPRSVTRSISPEWRKSLIEKMGLAPFNQKAEPACGSCAVAGAVMIRRKLYCDAQCKCSNPVEVFSWSFLHNQLMNTYGARKIYLKNILDLLQQQGIPLSVSFPNHSSNLPDKNQMQAAEKYKYWTYKPIFNARKSFSDQPNIADSLFKIQLEPQTIARLKEGIPVIVGLWVTNSFLTLDSNDCRWVPPISLKDAQGHAMVVVGYDDLAKEFLLLNSYGKNWGCSGTVRISYNDYSRVVKEGYELLFDFKSDGNREKIKCSRK